MVVEGHGRYCPMSTTAGCTTCNMNTVLIGFNGMLFCEVTFLCFG